MRSIVFYPDAADHLNDFVSRKIAAHLFIFCHYDPEISPVFGADAKYIRGVMNLYKLVFDASIVGNLDVLARKYAIQYAAGDIRNILDIIQALRTVEGHNVRDEAVCRRRDRWLLQMVGTEHITSMDDYEKALAGLEKMGMRLHNLLYAYVKNASLCKRKNEMVCSWENLILDFYSRKSNARIFEEQLRIAYISRCSVMPEHQLQDQRIRYKLGVWCKNHYVRKEEEKAALLENILKKRAGSMGAGDRKKIEHSIAEYRKKVRDTKQKIALEMECRDAENISVYKYLDFYFLNLRTALKEVLVNVTEEQDGTMQPEDLMQRLIARDFDGVSGEDF